MTSKFSIDNRELLQRISSGEAVVGIDFGNLIVRELAAFRLAAMDSESECLPLDYLQGHKDGLEWAAKLAEANHPETGDWLYDDPIELAKAIRKGPDMPPVQPVADSEPDRNPVLAYADSYRDMAKQGVQSVPIWSVITDLERNIAPLYRHAQPVPVSYSDFEEFWSAYIHPLAQDDELKGFAWDIWSVLGSNSQPAPVVPDEMLCEFYEVDSWPDLIRELVKHVEQLQDSARRNVKPWEDTFPETLLPAYIERVKQADDACRAAMLAAAPQSPGSEPATVPGKWIPVSEQKPDCWCRTCRPVVLNDMRFVVCPDCGNKRCPRANDHRNACTGSNEPGQEGSAYPDTPREVKP